MSKMITFNEFLDRFIQGGRGSWYFDIEISPGKQISGGNFYNKQNARDLLIRKLIAYLETGDPDTWPEVRP